MRRLSPDDNIGRIGADDDPCAELQAENERLRNGLFAIENYILNHEESAEWNINQCRLLAAMAREGK